MSTLKQQSFKAFIWDFSGKLARQGMSFVVSIILTRLLSPSDFGLVAMTMVVIGITGIFSNVGLGSALIQRRRVLPIHYSSVFFFNLTVGTLLTIIVYLSAPVIAEFYGNDRLISLTRAASLLFVINAFSAVQSTVLRKELNYALLTKMSFASSLTGGIVGIVLAYLGMGPWALIVQSLFQGIIFNILIWSASRWKPTWQFSLKALFQLWGFGFHMFLSGLLETIFMRLDMLIIGKMFPPATLGFFNRAKALDRMIVSYSSGSLMSVFFPLLSKVQHDLPRFQRIVLKALGIILFITFFLIGMFYLVSHELVAILYGEKWLAAVDYFKILVLSGFGYPVSALLVNVLSSRGNSKGFLKLEIYKKIIGALNLLLLIFFGIDAFLYGLMVQTTFSVFLNIAFASTEILLPRWAFIKPILSQVAITTGAVLLVEILTGEPRYGLFILFLLKGIIYLTLFIILNKLFRTSSYTYFMVEFKLISAKTRKRFTI